MNNNSFRDPVQAAGFRARSVARTEVQKALLALWNVRGMQYVKSYWDEFWKSWDAYNNAVRELEHKSVEQRSEPWKQVDVLAGEFDFIALESARFAAREFLKVSENAHEGLKQAMAAATACWDVSKTQ